MASLDVRKRRITIDEAKSAIAVLGVEPCWLAWGEEHGK